MAGPEYNPNEGGYRMPPRKRIAKKRRPSEEEKEILRANQQRVPRRIKRSDEEKEAERVSQWPQESPFASDILAEERRAAAGKTGVGAAAGKTAVGYAPDDEDTNTGTAPTYDDGAGDDGTRLNLKNQEAGSNFYRPEGDGSTSRAGKIGGIIKSAAKKQRNLWAIGIISSIVGGGWMFVLLAIMSGPLQFIHMGKSVEQFHMSIQDAQTGAVALKLARNIYHVSNGNRFKTNLGFVGNRYADRIDNSMREKGIDPDYRGGFFRGYVIDPAKVNSSDHPGMRGNSPEAIRDYYAERYGVTNATVEGGRVRLPATGRYLTDARMVYATMRSAKFGVLTPVNAHIAKKRIGFTLNPMSYWIQTKDNQILEGAENQAKRLNEWQKQQRQYVRQGTGPINARFTAGTDAEGNTNPSDQQGADEAQAINDEVQDTSQAVEEGDTSRINQFRQSIHAKMTGAVSAAIGILCFARAIATQYDIFTQDSIIQPMERISFQSMSWGSVNELGTSDVVDEEANGFMGDRLCDETGCWSDARPIQAYFNRAESGMTMPEESEISPEGNFLTRALEQIPGLDKACSATGQIILGILGAIIAGPISTAISVGGGLLAGPVLEKFVDWIIKTFLAEQVDPNAEGQLLGLYAERGALYGGNDVGLGSAGNVLTAAESAALREDGKSYQASEFENQSLAYRLFDSKDPRSFAAQIIDRQRPDPVENVSNVAISILNIGRNFGSTLLQPLNAQVSAATGADYTNGWNLIAFKPALLNGTDRTVENLYVNADMAADILDATEGADGIDNYIRRAKVCFGRDIVKAIATDENGQQYEQWTVAPPTPGEAPTYKVVAEDDNKCDEGDDNPAASTKSMQVVGSDRTIDFNNVAFTDDTITPWQRVRLFIKSSDVMNSMACRMASPNDEVGQKACTDVGNEDNSGAE